MKRCHWISLGIVVCTIFSLGAIVFAKLIPFDASMSFPITVEEAKASARAWAADPSLELSLVGVEDPEEGDDLPPYYVLLSADGRQRFMVDCTNGHVHHWRDVQATQQYLRAIEETPYDESGHLPASELTAAVREFLIAHYPQFLSLDMQPVGTGALVAEYCQRLQGSVRFHGRSAACEINPWTGAIVSYMAWFSDPPAISLEHTVTVSQAQQAAMQHAKTLELADSTDQDGNTVDATPQTVLQLPNAACIIAKHDGVDRVVWVVGVLACLEPGYTLSDYENELITEPSFPEGQIWGIMVDANTGAILGCEQLAHDRPLLTPTATPTFEPDGGTYSGSQTVTISCSTDGAVIRYTTDGSSPIESSTEYTGPITVDQSMTLSARAYAPGYRGSLAKTAAYDIQ